MRVPNSSTIRIQPGRRPGNRIIQKAVDQLAALGGGVVEIRAGVYLMESALELRSGVQLVGESGAILRKIPSVSSPLTQMSGFGHYEFLVKEPGKFKVGMGVCLSDRKAFGFYETVGTISAKKGNALFIDEPFHHDYLPSQGAFVRSVFPLLRGVGVRNVSVTNLTLEAPGEKHPINGCLGGAIILLQSHEVEMKDLEVWRYHGEGISFQQCTDILIQHCKIHHNKGNGIHPGSGSVRYRLLENSIHHNTRCGIFYCFLTTHSLCQGNQITNNALAGISIGERDTDHHLTQNTILMNGGPGIEIREKLRQSGERILLEKNLLSGNCKIKGKGEISLADGISDIRIIGNHFPAFEAIPLAVGEACRRIEFVGNRVADRMQEPADLAAAASPVRVVRGGEFPPVGPEAARKDSARHLGIATLSPDCYEKRPKAKAG